MQIEGLNPTPRTPSLLHETRIHSNEERNPLGCEFTVTAFVGQSPFDLP